MLSESIYPNIDLGEVDNYCIGLIGLHTYNSIPNIDEGCNKFYYKEKTDNILKCIVIPTGSYEISDIEKYIDTELRKGITDVKPNKVEKLLSLKPNNNTLKCEIFSEKYEINFKPMDSIATLLGFSHKTLSVNQNHESDLPVSIAKVHTIRIHCNIVQGAFYNGKESHTLYEFAVSVDPGYAINIEPQHIIYLPVNASTISNITVKILDQNSEFVNFRSEKIIVRLELKKCQ